MIGRKNLDRPLPIQSDGEPRDWNSMSHLSKTHFVWIGTRIPLNFQRRTKWSCNSNELKRCKKTHDLISPASIRLRWFISLDVLLFILTISRRIYIERIKGPDVKSLKGFIYDFLYVPLIFFGFHRIIFFLHLHCIELHAYSKS